VALHIPARPRDQAEEEKVPKRHTTHADYQFPTNAKVFHLPLQTLCVFPSLGLLRHRHQLESIVMALAMIACRATHTLQHLLESKDHAISSGVALPVCPNMPGLRHARGSLDIGICRILFQLF
jgi:hypothetical protein